jgi:hypothetical protein
LTNRLIRKQLIERRSAEGDRRWVNIELSERGRLLMDGFRRRRNEVFGEALSRLNEDDRALAIEALSKLTAVIEATEQPLHEPKVRLRRAPTGGRTPLEPTLASKDVDQPKVDQRPASRPARRMKIEWD